MCGIAGIVTCDRSSPSEELLRGMAQRIAHRGPDGEGVWSASGIGFAHRRLAIIDLSPEASQPMHDAMRRLTITFNGEIYNYRDLRSELMARGVVFRTTSDTEVILESYRAWGVDCLIKLRGMFAFGLWDHEREQLLLARDRIGKKPLFYAYTPDGHFCFASEIKALASIITLRPDWSAMRLFLGLQYVPSPRTGFENVSQLLPGTYGMFGEGEWRIERYHHAERSHAITQNAHAPAPSSKDEQRIAAELVQKIDEAVALRKLAADVPVGAFLSGGIDSAAIVAFAARHSERPLQTFTMGFPNLAMDERREARAIAEYFHTDHSEFEAHPKQLESLVDDVCAQYDAPYADSSALPLWLLARETSQQIKVVLTGDGGDELFGGYRRYGAYEHAMELAATPASWLWPPLLQTIGSFFKDPRYLRMALTVRTLRQDPVRAYGELFCDSYFSTHALSELCHADFLERTRDADSVDYVTSVIRGHDTRVSQKKPRCFSEWREILMEAAMQFDLASYLPDDLNVKMDRATMRYGLEARCPFLDQELVSFVTNLSLKLKVFRGKKKIMLKRALEGVVPDDVLRRPKRGFQVPLAEWFRGPLRTLVRERTLDARLPLARVCNVRFIERLITQNDQGYDHGNRLWMLLSLSSWLARYAK